MTDAPLARPFPSLLVWVLLVSVAMFACGVIARIQGSASELAFVLFVVPMAMSGGAELFAIFLLVARSGYRTMRNVLVTLVGAIPVVAFFGMWFLSSLRHMHM